MRLRCTVVSSTYICTLLLLLLFTKYYCAIFSTSCARACSNVKNGVPLKDIMSKRQNPEVASGSPLAKKGRCSDGIDIGAVGGQEEFDLKVCFSHVRSFNAHASSHPDVRTI